MPKGGLADDEEQKGSLADAAWEDQPGYVFRGALAEDKWVSLPKCNKPSQNDSLVWLNNLITLPVNLKLKLT